MFFGILTLISALTISAVAIYYSVAGLVAIFAAAAIPIIIMGTALEIGKLVTAVWLHRYWQQATWWLKTYLSVAVFVLMFITSMGIFGFLSKAHVDQNLASDTVTQRIEIIDSKIQQEKAYITRQQAVLDRISGQDKGNESRFNQDIQIEQKKIDDAYKRLEVLDADVKAYTDQGSGFLKGDNVKRGLEVRKSQQPERDRINQQITEAQQNINKLRSQINSTLDNNTTEIKNIESNIFDAQGRIENLLLEQQPLKGDIMKLESEVGPIRYIAEFIYGEQANKNLLEEAVRWVIITIIFVFDPLAVLLLIASQYTFYWRNPNKGGALPPKPNPAPKPEGPAQEKTVTETIKQDSADIEIQAPTVSYSLSTQTPGQFLMWKDEDPVVDNIPKKHEQPVEQQHDANQREFNFDKEESQQVPGNDLEKWNEWVEAANKAAQENPEIDDNEDDIFSNVSPEEKDAMQRWKKETGGSLKTQKWYHKINRIKELPWMKYLQPQPDFEQEKKFQIMPELEKTIRTGKPAYTEVVESEQIQKKKAEYLNWMEKDGNRQIKRSKEIEKEE
jgi:hypothetical protein